MHLVALQVSGPQVRTLPWKGSVGGGSTVLPSLGPMWLCLAAPHSHCLFCSIG